MQRIRTGLSIVAISVVSLAVGCSASSDDSAETDDAVVGETSTAADALQRALATCEAASAQSARLECLKKANDEANKDVDRLQKTNWPNKILLDYLTLAVPLYRVHTEKLCTGAKDAGKIATTDKCLADRELDMSKSILEFAYGVRIAQSTSPLTGQGCSAPDARFQGDDEAEDRAYVEYGICLVNEVKATYGAYTHDTAWAGERICDPIATAANVGKGDHTINVQSARCWITSIENLASELAAMR